MVRCSGVFRCVPAKARHRSPKPSPVGTPAWRQPQSPSGRLPQPASAGLPGNHRHPLCPSPVKAPSATNPARFPSGRAVSPPPARTEIRVDRDATTRSPRVQPHLRPAASRRTHPTIDPPSPAVAAGLPVGPRSSRKDRGRRLCRPGVARRPPPHERLQAEPASSHAGGEPVATRGLIPACAAAAFRGRPAARTPTPTARRLPLRRPDPKAGRAELSEPPAHPPAPDPMRGRIGRTPATFGRRPHRPSHAAFALRRNRRGRSPAADTRERIPKGMPPFVFGLDSHARACN